MSTFATESVFPTVSYASHRDKLVRTIWMNKLEQFSISIEIDCMMIGLGEWKGFVT